MEIAAGAATIVGVRDRDSIRRYTLVPRPPGGGTEGIRRYRLARLGVTPRSALGADRHERLERIADPGEEPEGDGGEPEGRGKEPEGPREEPDGQDRRS